MSIRLGIRIEPLDVLFFRDGRPFDVGMRATGNAPLPQTLAGALRTHVWQQLGIDFSKMPDALRESIDDVCAAAKLLLPKENAWAADLRVCGPWLARDDKPLVAVPADLAREGKKSDDGKVVRLSPAKTAPPGWRPLAEGMLPLWHRGQQSIDRASGYLTPEGLARYLDGGVPASEHLVGSGALWEQEDRTGIGIDMDKNSAEDGQIYSVGFMRLKQGVTFYAEVELPAGAPQDAAERFKGVLAFGGEGRRCSLSVLKTPFGWPETKLTGDGALALLVTPGVFLDEPTWRPDALLETKLVAATVPGSVAISGWDLAKRCPKPVRHGVVAGSVFHAAKIDCQKSGPFLRLCNGNELNAQGYGLALKGAWKHV